MLFRSAIIEVLDRTSGVTEPSEDAFFFGRSFVQSNGCILREDGLTEAEIQFLCGTYKVQKGMSRSSTLNRTAEPHSLFSP